MKIKSQYLALILVVWFPFALSACIGLAHVRVEMPPLTIQGLLLDENGQPIAGNHIVVALSDFYAKQQTFAALKTGRLSGNDYEYSFQKVQTGPNGEFSCRLPGESRYIGFTPLLMSPSEDTLKSFLVGLRTNSGAVVAVRVSGTTTTVRVPVGQELKLVPIPDDYPVKVSASVVRLTAQDVLQLVVQVQNAGT